MLSILANRIFGRLFAAQVVALLGTGLLTIALGLLAYDVAGSAAGAVLGTALAIKMAAYVFVSPVISALTHRWSCRGLLVGANVVRAAIALMLPFVDQAWQIYVLIFVLQSASAAFTPAFQSVIPEVLVDEDDYTRGLSLSRLAYDLESLVSPVIAAALLALVTYNWLFLGTVGGFALSALLVYRSWLPDVCGTRGEQPAQTFWQRVTSGSRVMVRRPVLRALLLLNLAVAAATALVVVNTVVYVRDLLGGAAAQVAILLACYGGGSMVVALLVPRLLVVAADRRVMLAGATAIAVGLSLTTIALIAIPAPAAGWVVFAALWSVLGAATSLINTPAARLLRYQSDPATRSPVFTAQFALSHACFLVTYPLAGWLGALAGQSVAAAVLGVLAAVAATAAARAWPRLGSVADALRRAHLPNQ